MKFSSRMFAWALLCGLPRVCMAEAGELGGVVELAFYVLVFLALWLLASVVLFRYFLRRTSTWKRLILT